MPSTWTMRVPAVAGFGAAALILGAMYTVWATAPGPDADPGGWATWARREEQRLEIGVYALLAPGLLLFLVMFAALARLMPTEAIETRLAGYGAVGFAIFFATAAVLLSTAASAFGFYPAFDDPGAVTILTGFTAGYHLQALGVWSLAVTMLATALGLRASGSLSLAWSAASVVLAVVAVAATFMGFGAIPCLVWIVAVSAGLARSRPSPGRADNRIAAAGS